MRFFDAILLGVVLLAGMGLFYGVSRTPAQQTPQFPTQQRAPTLPDARHGGNSDEEENPMARQLATQQANRRADARQKLIVDDTAKLVQLAQQLKDGMDKGKAPGDSSFTKKAEEIEHLAKAVKEKMREGQ